ncbi:hypothetical protein KM043_015568 [Ampulex compressa]|nr:hypothetical protein KM043_015568 [Ampulex compressa]
MTTSKCAPRNDIPGATPCRSTRHTCCEELHVDRHRDPKTNYPRERNTLVSDVTKTYVNTHPSISHRTRARVDENYGWEMSKTLPPDFNIL